MIEIILFVGFAVLLGRVMAEFHRNPFHFGLSKYRVTIAEYRRINKGIYK